MPNLDLGKYAVYIVPAYAVAAVVIAVMVGDTLARTARWKREVEKREALRNGQKRKA
jgi:heme exporter protein CcmD